MKDDLSEDEFTFSIQGKEYVIKDKFQPAKDKSKINFLHGPSIGIGTAITAICVIIVFFSVNVNDDMEQVLIEKQISESTITEQQSQVSQDTFYKNSSPILGDPNASITLIEFGDYQCHFCNVYFHNTGNKILENYVSTGKVKMLFKDYTIIGPDSVGAAKATHCAAEQNKYWEYHHTLYANWAGENNGWASKENLIKFANNINLESNQFSECIDSQRYDDIIEQSYIDGQSLGLTGTPAFFIISNDNQVLVINGAQPYDVFERVFNSILEN